jgi:rhomboid protease GluP
VTNEAEIEFLQTVWTRRPVFTYIFFGINFAVFLLMTFAGGTTNDATLMAFGVKANALINQGQYWRFVTPIFIHIGLLHLGFNSYALWIVGPQVEKLYGGARFVLFYLVTGAAGVLGSYLYRPDGLSAGASGAIFGLFGVLLVFGIRHRESVPPSFRRAFGTGILPVILINLVIGFVIPMIDVSAHVGGLIAGMALAAVIPFQRPGARTPAVFTAIQIVLFGIVLASFYEVAVHYDGPRIAFQNLYSGWGTFTGGQSTTDGFITAMNDAQRAFNISMKALDSTGRQKPSFQTPIKEIGKSIDELKAAPSLSAKADDLTAQMLVLLQSEYALLQDVQRSGTMTMMDDRQARENAGKYQAFMETFFAWVESDGKRYGIQLRQSR